MNQRIKNLWIKALRSGKFRQAKGKMRVGRGNNIAYCCLGVLEQIRCNEKGVGFTSNGGLPSKATKKWAELYTRDPILEPGLEPGLGTSASEMNDADKKFSYIADRIEKYL